MAFIIKIFTTSILTLAITSEVTADILQLTCLGKYQTISQGKKLPLYSVKVVANINQLAGEGCLILSTKTEERPEKCYPISVSDREFVIHSDKVRNKGSSVVYPEKTTINRYSGKLRYYVEEIFGGTAVNSYSFNLACKKTANIKSEKQF